MRLFEYFQLFFEGGGLGKKFGAEKIYKDDIQSTVDYFLKKFKEITGINIDSSKVKILGSAGKKEYSGDIDISVPKSLSKTLVQYLIIELQKSKKRDLFLNNVEKSNPGIDENQKNAIAALNFGRSVGSPFNLEAKGIKLLTTIKEFDLDDGMPGLIPFVVNQVKSDGSFGKDKVQLDLNFGEEEWMTFAYHYTPEESPDSRPIKGLHRNAILASLVENLGGIWGFQRGFKKSKKDKKFNENKKDFLDFLSIKLKMKIEESNLSTYASILKIVKQLDKIKRKNIYDLVIQKLGSSLVPEGVFIPSEKDFNL